MTGFRRPAGSVAAVLASLLLASGDTASGDTASGEMAPGQQPVLSSVAAAVRFPRSVECGSGFEASLSFANDGDVPWREGVVALGAVDDSDPFTPELRVALPPGTEVLPGESHTFELRLTAPEIPLPVTVSDWRLVTADGYWFGGVASARVTVRCPERVEDAEVVSAELPMDATCSQPYEGSIRVRNNGTTTWSGREGYGLRQVGDEGFTPRRVALPEAATVAPGEERAFSIDVRAPAVDGSVRTEWRMSRRGAGVFGASVEQWVRVRCPPAAS